MIKKIMILAMTGMFITACSGDSDVSESDSLNLSDSDSDATIYTAIKGEVDGATAVCFGDDDVQISSTTTASDGTFTLVCPADGYIEVSGGIDITTGEPVSGLIADADSKYITPVTSLARLVRKGEVSEDSVDKDLLEKAKNIHPLKDESDDAKKIAKLGVVLNSYALQVVNGTAGEMQENRKDYKGALEWLSKNKDAGSKLTDWADDTTTDDTKLDNLHLKFSTELGITLTDDMKGMLKELRKKPALAIRDNDKVKDGIKNLISTIKSDKGYTIDFEEMHKPAPSKGDVKSTLDTATKEITFAVKGSLKKKLEDPLAATYITSLTYQCKFFDKGTAVADYDFTDAQTCVQGSAVSYSGSEGKVFVVKIEGIIAHPIFSKPRFIPTDVDSSDSTTVSFLG